MSGARNYGWEALAEVTGSDWEASKGELSVALKSIRAQAPSLTPEQLSDEIHRRAKMYRDVMGDDIMLTPTALAKHWKRVEEESAPRVRGTNQNSGNRDCDTCGGNRFVVVNLRKPVVTEWMRAHSIKVNEATMIEETAPCPDCNPIEVSHWRHDGTRFVTPDPGRVRELMNG